MTWFRSALLVTVGSLMSIQTGQSLASPVDLTSHLTVNLGYASYRGVQNATTGLNVWNGIRYAAPPIDDLRWRAPSTPAKDFNYTIDATEYGPFCPQAAPAPFEISPLGDEDCLFLNVYSPTNGTGKKLPVLVWIHGGGYGSGNGAQDMSEIINENQNTFVAVSIQYRLGAFGFLSSDEVEKNGALNAGILDIAFALQWVQNNIGKFGGDATQVTISGLSAGAGAVGMMTIAKDGSIGTSLFRNAIVISPFFPIHHKYNAPQPTKAYHDFVDMVGCSESTDTLACLRAKDSTTLQEANKVMSANYFFGTWPFLPVVDTDFLTTLPSTALFNKRVNGENIIVSNTANEAPYFVPQTITTLESLKTWLRGAFPDLTNSEIDAVLDEYPSSDAPDDPSAPRFATSGTGPATAINVSSIATGHQQRANNLYAEITFECPSYWLNDAFATEGRTSYHYQYSVPVALHGDDIAAYFGPATPNLPDSFTTIAHRILGSFIVSGSPEDAVESWPEWVEGPTSQMLNLNVTGGVPYTIPTFFGPNITQYMEPGLQTRINVVNAKTWEGGRGARCNFWKGIVDKVPT